MRSQSPADSALPPVGQRHGVIGLHGAQLKYSAGRFLTEGGRLSSVAVADSPL
jgi:hypothetical protein